MIFRFLKIRTGPIDIGSFNLEITNYNFLNSE